MQESGHITLPMSPVPSPARDGPTQTFEIDSPDTAQTQLKSRGITALTVDIPLSHKTISPSAPQRPSLWKTPEFMFYGVVFAVAVPVMIWIPITLSNQSHPNYPIYQNRLSPGWILGRKVDNSDYQYRSFRNNVPILALTLTGFMALKTCYSYLSKQWIPGQRSDSLYLAPFNLIFSLVFLTALYGASIIKIAVILSLNYAIAKASGRSKFAPLLTWIFNGAILFANETFEGYRFGHIHPFFEYLDTLNGIGPRWNVGFNITMLRLVSFNMDYYWAIQRNGLVDSGHVLGDKERPKTFHSLDIYSFTHYISYALYSPLYLAGPIITFNDFMWQLRRPTRMRLADIAGYMTRFLICILTMEFILHYMYVVAIKNTVAWKGDSVAELSMIGLWNLFVVWLKLLVPWRFFRLWALLDNIDPPENMVRCMTNNYSTLGFWRAWHRSYNLWIVRYIYIPLGGAKNVISVTVLVFTFVALWHDLSFKLLAWGWLVSLFILPELIAQYLLPQRKYGDQWWYRHICALGGVLNILMMMAANLVGFVIGTDGIKYLLSQLFGTWEGVRFLAVTCCCLFIATQVMFEYREEEMRKGIFRRC